MLSHTIIFTFILDFYSFKPEYEKQKLSNQTINPLKNYEDEDKDCDH